jgi:hypothetical protein
MRRAQTFSIFVGSLLFIGFLLIAISNIPAATGSRYEIEGMIANVYQIRKGHDPMFALRVVHANGEKSILCADIQCIVLMPRQTARFACEKKDGDDVCALQRVFPISR